MAVIRLDCNLNGGDSVTPNNELFYRIYGDVDSFTTPIHETGTALSDANVTVNNDNVIITGVDGTINTSFKIAAVDGAGNEGILSDAVSSTIILFEDDFAGTVIDTAKWDVVNPDTPNLDISQSDKIIFDLVASGSAGFGDNYIISKIGGLVSTGITVFGFDMWWQNQNQTTPAHNIGIVASTARQDSFIFVRNATAGTIGFNVVEGGTSGTQLNATVDLSVITSFKYVFNNGDLTVHYWNGSSWSLLDTRANGYSGTFYFYITCNNQAINDIDLDNVYVTNADYSTQYPT